MSQQPNDAPKHEPPPPDQENIRDPQVPQHEPERREPERKAPVVEDPDPTPEIPDDKGPMHV